MGGLRVGVVVKVGGGVEVGRGVTVGGGVGAAQDAKRKDNIKAEYDKVLDWGSALFTRESYSSPASDSIRATSAVLA